MENWMCNVLPPCLLDSEYAMHQITGPLILMLKYRQEQPSSEDMMWRILLQLQYNSWLVTDLEKWSILTEVLIQKCVHHTFPPAERYNVRYSRAHVHTVCTAVGWVSLYLSWKRNFALSLWNPWSVNIWRVLFQSVIHFEWANNYLKLMIE